MTRNDYNKEGFPRGVLSTAVVDCHRSRRLRWQSTAKVDKKNRGNPSRYIFILSTFPDPLRYLNMSEHTKTTRHTLLRNHCQHNGCYVLSHSKHPVRSFVQKGSTDAPPGDSFQYLYRLLWRILIVKWNSIESCFHLLNGNAYGASPGMF